MLDLHWGIVDSIKNKLQGIFKTIMLAPFFFYKWFGFRNKEVKYSRHSILYFKLLWNVTSADSYLSMEDK